MGKRVPLCCTVVVYMGHCNGCIKLELNDVISLYKKNDSERGRSVSLYYLVYYFIILLLLN